MIQSNRPSPSDYVERDIAILKSAYRLNIGLAESISATVTRDKPPGHIFRRLEAKGLLELFSRAIPGGHSYVRITSRGLKEIGLEAKKLTHLGTVGLDLAIAISWHVSLDDERRFKLLGKETKELFGQFVPVNVPHVLTGEFGELSLMRIYHGTGKIISIRKHVKSFLLDARTKEGIAPAFLNREYGLTVLCPTTEKTEQVRAELKKAELFEKGRLSVCLGPTAETYSFELKRRRKKKGDKE